MGIADYFRPVETMNAEEVREFLRTHRPEEYNLVDVRQPNEYERGHLPGAVLIPVAELPERLAELDRTKPTITYCAAGVRSRAAASVLRTAGFSTVHSMAGGINAWEGLTASGPPEAGMVVFPEGVQAEDLLAVAWVLEEGSRRFYTAVSVDMEEGAAIRLFLDLAMAEERHKASLRGLYQEITGREPGPDFPRHRFPGDETYMEGGIRVREAIAWAKGRKAREIFDFAIALETNSYDLYIKMGRRVSGDPAKQVFDHLIEEERQHLARMTEALEQNL